jgi:methylglutaconyl-CoA hydratase
MEDPSSLIYAVDGHVAHITLNRPDKRNALNDTLVHELKAALRQADADAEIRVIVINGAGPDFCSGADLASLQKFAESSITENRDDANNLMELFDLVRRVQVPVVAAVRGRALAGGCGLATACDIVLASRSARFGYPEVKIGFVPAMVMAILRRNVSEKRAFELITLGRQLAADEAAALGLINHVFEDDSFEHEVAQFVAGFGRVGRSAVVLTKRLFYEMDGMTFESALRSGVDVNTIARMTEDCKKGIASFLKS